MSHLTYFSNKYRFNEAMQYEIIKLILNSIIEINIMKNVLEYYVNNMFSS